MQNIKKISLVFHNGSYDYHFIINELAKEFEGKCECFGENTEKYIALSVLIKEGLYNGKTITHELKFIDSFRFMSPSLPKIVNNLSEIYSKSVEGVEKEKKNQITMRFYRT